MPLQGKDQYMTTKRKRNNSKMFQVNGGINLGDFHIEGWIFIPKRLKYLFFTYNKSKYFPPHLQDQNIFSQKVQRQDII